MTNFVKLKANSQENIQSKHNFHPNYRPDIDGLRAIAILPVVFFHAFPQLIPGGFIGVDIFFVISGYLISTILFKSIERGQFSFLEFYQGRIRRLFPALLLMLTVSLLIGRNMLIGHEWRSLGAQVAAGLGFYQNFHLLHQVGYFDTAAELKPMLHLWSLSIEEQYYLVFPLILVLSRKKKWLLGLIVFFAMASFSADLVVGRTHIARSFFLPYTRFWELLGGAVLAWAGLNVPRWAESPQPRRLHSLLSLAGFALILTGVFAFNSGMAYPGWRALLPVLGAIALIGAGRHGLINRMVLSNPAAIFIGRISYPLYLWHWPILSFMTIANGHRPDPVKALAAIAASLVLSWLTYTLVEKPIRNASPPKPRIVPVLLGCGLIVALVGAEARHFAKPYDTATMNIINSWEFRGYPLPAGARQDPVSQRLFLGDNPRRKILFLGDSHALQYGNLLGELWRQRARNGTPPQIIIDHTRPDFPLDLSADEAADPGIQTVVLSSFWALHYLDGKVNQKIRCCGTGLMGVIGKANAPLTPTEMEHLDQRLEASIRQIQASGRHVILILDNSFGEETSPRFMLKRSLLEGIHPVSTSLDRATMLDRDGTARRHVLAVAAKTGITVIDPLATLCPGDHCITRTAEGIPVNKDYDHLSLNTVLHHIHYLDDLILRP